MAEATASPTSLPADSQITTSTSIEYWSSTPSTVDGMLGGFPQVSRIDITGSRTFLVKLLRHSNPSPTVQAPHKVRLVADTGAGIGRITVNLLSQLSQHVDVIEPIPKFTEQLKANHPELFAGSKPTIQNVVNVGLESWDPHGLDSSRRYDVIWNQWCLGHLTDKQLTTYLHRLTPALSSNGWIVVKENVLQTDNGASNPSNKSSSTSKQKRDRDARPSSNATSKTANNKSSNSNTSSSSQRAQTTTQNSNDTHENPNQQEHDSDSEPDSHPDLYDELDSSVTRTERKFTRIFHAAGLKIVKTEIQRGFGKDLGLFPVRMWGLQPAVARGD